MTRAEWFVLRGRGHWTRARRDSQCDCVGHFGPCLSPLKVGDVYFATDLPKFPKAPSGSKQAFIKMRYCAHCAHQELPFGRASASASVTVVKRCSVVA